MDSGKSSTFWTFQRANWIGKSPTDLMFEAPTITSNKSSDVSSPQTESGTKKSLLRFCWLPALRRWKAQCRKVPGRAAPCLGLEIRSHTSWLQLRKNSKANIRLVQSILRWVLLEQNGFMASPWFLVFVSSISTWVFCALQLVNTWALAAAQTWHWRCFLARYLGPSVKPASRETLLLVTHWNSVKAQELKHPE